MGSVWDKSCNLYKEFKPFSGTTAGNGEFEAGESCIQFFFFLNDFMRSVLKLLQISERLEVREKEQWRGHSNSLDKT